MSELETKEIGARIKQMRGQMTQKEFADFIGIGRTSVVRYEAGERTPDAEFIAKVHSTLGVDPIWLLTGQGAKPLSHTPREAALLDNYRHCPPEGQDAIDKTSALLAQPKCGKKTG